MAKQIRYSEEFKRQAVSNYLQGALSCNQISQNIHVHPNTLSKWIRQQKDSSQRSTAQPVKEMGIELPLPAGCDIDAIVIALTGIEAQVAALKKLLGDYQ